MAQIESRKDVLCTKFVGFAVVVAVEYRADHQRTNCKSEQTHSICVPGHIVTVQQQIAEHECGLIEHSRLVAAEQNEQRNRSSIDEQSANRTGKVSHMRSNGHNAEKSGKQKRGLSCANAQMRTAEHEQIQQHDYADNAVVCAEAKAVQRNKNEAKRDRYRDFGQIHGNMVQLFAL